MKTNLCLSHIISPNAPSYGNRDRFILGTNSSIQQGESSNSSTWVFTNNHLGTHIDVPYHFCEKGKRTFEIPIANYIFSMVQLIDIPCTAARLIGIKDLIKSGQINKEIELLLIRTGFEALRYEDCYWNDNPGLDAELATYFRENFTNLRCIGFDFISLTSWKYRIEGRESHLAFLCPGRRKRPILVIEDMSLKFLSNKINWVIVAPLFVEDGNGGPVTVFANQNS